MNKVRVNLYRIREWYAVQQRVRRAAASIVRERSTEGPTGGSSWSQPVRWASALRQLQAGGGEASSREVKTTNAGETRTERRAPRRRSARERRAALRWGPAEARAICRVGSYCQYRAGRQSSWSKTKTRADSPLAADCGRYERVETFPRLIYRTVEIIIRTIEWQN